MNAYLLGKNTIDTQKLWQFVKGFLSNLGSPSRLLVLISGDSLTAETRESHQYLTDVFVEKIVYFFLLGGLIEILTIYVYGLCNGVDEKTCHERVSTERKM